MLRFDFRLYRRPFQAPLKTAHGPWQTREGIILRFEDEHGQVCFGEIAPIPWFGSETLEQAREFCANWPRKFFPEKLLTIPETLPACQFGFSVMGGVKRQESGIRTTPLPRLKKFPVKVNSVGWVDAKETQQNTYPNNICALLPAGVEALDVWRAQWDKGHRTFKWKIGVAAIADELSLFEQLITVLPSDAQLRLDANGGLSSEEAETWLVACDRTQGKVEFLEQPLSPNLILKWVEQRAVSFETAIALDESVATVSQLRGIYGRLGDQVVYVMKPAISGSIHAIQDFCQQHPITLVFSSALETPIGRNAVITLAQNLWAQGLSKRALGFGVDHWFADDWSRVSEAAIWERLDQSRPLYSSGGVNLG